MDEWLIPVAVQLPLAALVVFLTLKFLDHLKEMRKMDNATIESIHKESLEFASKEAEINRAFLTAQRAQMNESLARLAEEIKTNSINMSKEHSLSIDAIQRVIDYINGINK